MKSKTIVTPRKPTRPALLTKATLVRIILWVAVIALLSLAGALLVPQLEELRETLAGWLFFLAGALFYFVPALIARQRQHPNQEAIVVLNLFGGWTGLGWIIALVWAYTKKT